MSELKTCADILAKARLIAEENVGGGREEEILFLARKMGLIACPGCRAKFRSTLLKSGIDEAVLDAAINEGLEDPNRYEAIKEKILEEIQRHLDSANKGAMVRVLPEGEEVNKGKTVSKKKK